MNKKKLRIICISAVVILIIAALFIRLFLHHEKAPENIDEIVNETINDLTNDSHSDYSLVGIILENCEYSVVETKDHFGKITSKLHVRQCDVYDILKDMQEDNEASNWEAFANSFKDALDKAEKAEADVKLSIVKNDNGYIAQMDEVTMDVFLGGYLAYTEETVMKFMEDGNL